MLRPNEKVLLVDDEPRILAGLRRRLSDRFHILTAESAFDAIKILESEGNIGAVVADMRMPERSGLELLVDMATHWPHIRRIMLTGNTDQETAIAAVNQGRVFRFFRKPCDADQLAAALDQALDEFRFITASSSERQTLEIKAKAGDKARKNFLSMMSHELLTPLNHVLGFSSMLEMKLQNTDEQEALQYLTYIKDSGESLLKIVQRVLEIVRLTSDHPRQDRQLIDVNPLIAEELNKIRAKADARRISLSFQAPSKSTFINTSQYELRIALGELLDNAVKFNQPGGQVSLAVSYARGKLTIRVADTGIGMTEDAIERALGLFSQAEDCDNRRYGGIGLGLTFVAFFAQAYNGRLAIESKKGSGTAIILTIACAEEMDDFGEVANIR
jgi:signal transduction histidine kinase